MPCTYCGNPKHTRKQCSEIAEDYRTYLVVSEKVRQEYVAELSDKGIVPDAVVRTYNRTSSFMNKSSEVKVVGIGPLDMFDCYMKVGRQTFANRMPTKEHIILGDDDDRMVSINHCYQVVQDSDRKWSPDDFTVPLMSNDEFLAMFNGKKRHVAFEMSVLNCVVKRLTQKTKTVDEMIAKMKIEEVPEAQEVDDSQAGSVYVVMATSHTDDYKRKNTSVESKTATSYDDALSIAAQMFLERADDWDSFYGEEEVLEEFAACVCEATDEILASAICNFFWDHETLFAGDYIPITFEVNIKEERSCRVPVSNLRVLSNEIAERLEEK